MLPNHGACHHITLICTQPGRLLFYQSTQGMYVCAYMYVCMYVCTCVYVCMYMGGSFHCIVACAHLGNGTGRRTATLTTPPPLTSGPMKYEVVLHNHETSPEGVGGGTDF